MSSAFDFSGPSLIAQDTSFRKSNASKKASSAMVAKKRAQGIEPARIYGISRRADEKIAEFDEQAKRERAAKAARKKAKVA